VEVEPGNGNALPPEPAQPKPASSWEAPLYRQLGWLSGLTFIWLGCGDNVWTVKIAFWLFGADLFVYWLIERIEERRGCKLILLRKALLPFWFAPMLFLLAGTVEVVSGWMF
jgi:hypothetical protein